ncbi:uncharacterized protein TA05280 [Theileria annulata]|uniref:Uncharacterized protein n=1 Tax=Theileria annulata TaxID=5874 RepID=Q4UCU8_THEAN|nr:uncharacterized protein TA05280 [Theileria annulata]CAI75353.1 hypothetical protein TA05280 [Theileria annulata]|eukprot:XP_954829.1 hypothetical protein TA05280 [Theileria annulata]
MKWFKIPWHSRGSTPSQVLKLVVYPLCTSLLTCCLSLNVLIYVLVNSRKFSDFVIALCYCSSIVSSASFILYVLAIVYSNYIFVIMPTLLQFILTVSSISVLVNFWCMSLSSKRSLVFNIVKYVLTFFCTILVIIQFRLALVSVALGKAMYERGNSWDLDDLESVDQYFKTHSIAIV